MLDSVNRIRRQFTPPKLISWQSLVLASLLFWLIFGLAIGAQYDLGFDRQFVAQLGWIFLFAGLAWWQLENPILIGGLSIGPWIISALICVLLFVRPSGEFSPLIWVVWPLLAAAIAIVPTIRDDSNHWTVPSVRKRSQLLLLTLGSVIVSCWFGFSLIIQSWIATYPELMAADVSNSNFVVRLGETGRSEGQTVINEMQEYIAQQTNGKPWGTIERFLLDIQLGKINFKEQVASKLPNSSNPDDWIALVEIIKGSEYDLKLYVRKPKLSEDRVGYSLTKTCYIRQSATTPVRGVGGDLIPTGTLSCDLYPQFNFE
jgi:Family of unknown function (DUF5357)